MSCEALNASPEMEIGLGSQDRQGEQEGIAILEYSCQVEGDQITPESASSIILQYFFYRYE